MLSQIFQWPRSLQTSHKLTKKSFYEHGQLSSSAKRLLQDEVESIFICAHLTPDNSNIPAFQSERHEYLELFWVELNLKSDQASSSLTPKQLRTLHELIHKAIAYPLVLQVRSGDLAQWSLAEKITQQGDVEHDKLIVTDLMQTGWVNVRAPESLEADFFQSLVFENLNRQNLYKLYQSMMLAFTSYLLAKQVERPLTRVEAETVTQQSLDDKRKKLKRINQLNKEVKELKNKVATSQQFNEKVELNLALQQLTNQLEQLKQE